MAIGGKVMRSRKRRIQQKDMGSDGSDEDYTVGDDEERDDSDEYYSSFGGDLSEENLSEFGEEDKKMKKKVGGAKTRKGFPAPKINGIRKPTKKKRASYKDKDADDYDNDEDDDEFTLDEVDDADDDDDEFTPDEIDFSDEDEPPVVNRKAKRRPRLQEVKLGKERKRKKNFKVPKKSIEKKSKNSRRLRKKACSNVRGSIEKSRVEEKTKKIIRHKTTRLTADSDSDFVSSGPSGFDYTTSEEEREQVREANEFCSRRLRTSLRNSTSSKRLKKEPTALIYRSERPGRKDKEKVEDSRNEAVTKQVYGSTKNAGEFERNQVVEENKEKICKKKRRRFIANSDSDYVSSGSSDVEYTISEAEREQEKEASEFFRTSKTSTRSLASSKILQEQQQVPCKQRMHPGRKDKEKVDELTNKVGQQVCGICLSEEGNKKLRGTLNCCNHYFCFACIMEWSKVESRCPLCKQRFSRISKPGRSKTGTIMIQVPERDQVYQPSEEELRGFLDPYENVICTECDHGGDDALMLLCDLCDSPAHTYCVGLGHQVPEGNWYCDGCRPTATDQIPTTDQRTSNNLSDGSTPVNNFDLNELYVPETPLTQETVPFQPLIPSTGDFQAVTPSSGVGAFTLSERRRIYRQIHHFRNNWMRQFGEGTSVFGSQMTQEVVPSHYSSFDGRFQNNGTTLLQNSDILSSRISYSSGHIVLQPTPPSVDSSLEAEIGGINSGISPRLGYEQLRPCRSRSAIGTADGTVSTFPVGEAATPSMTLQGARYAPF